jgi:hypothetical protein
VSGVEGGLDQRHARQGALGEKAPGIVGDKEAAITDKAEGVERGYLNGNAG